MKNYSLLDSPVGRTLFFKSLPIFLGFFANIAYNLVDTFFVARLGTNELAAMSFSFPIVMIVLNIMMGVATGITSLASRAIGAKEHDYAKQLAKKGLDLTLLLSMLISTIGLLTLEPLFGILGVSKELMPHTKNYMIIWYAGIVFMNLSIVGSSIFRAKGNVLFPSLMLILGACLNAILDPILIFGWGIIPAMGIKGAAITTVIGNAISAFFIFSKLYKDEKITISWIPKSCNLDLVKKILIIATPTALANSLVPLSTALTNRMLVPYGNAAVAANSIATRIETVPFIAIFALASVLTPFIGQNWGAKNIHRLREGIKKSFLFSYLLGFLSAIVLVTQNKNITTFFGNNPEVIEVTSIYFSLIPFTYGILGTVFLTIHSMNSIGKPFLGNFLSALRLIVIYFPLAYFLNFSYGLSGIFLSRFIANTVVGILATFLIYRSFYRKTELLKARVNN